MFSDLQNIMILTILMMNTKSLFNFIGPADSKLALGKQEAALTQDTDWTMVD